MNPEGLVEVDGVPGIWLELLLNCLHGSQPCRSVDVWAWDCFCELILTPPLRMSSVSSNEM